MMRTVVGAGSVGLALAARLSRAALPVRLVTRDADAARRLEAGGIRVEDPLRGERWCTPVRAAAGIENAQLRGAERPLLICVRATDTEALAAPLARLAPDATVVNVQNGLEGDTLLARHFPRVIGAVWRQTCTRVEPDLVRFSGRGRVVLGLHPQGSAPEVDALAEDLLGAGFDVGISSRIAEDRWLKLCVNLMSAPNALIRREDHDSRAFVEVKARLLEEARAVLAAHGIEARSCDGRDRSIDEEIRHQRESLERGTSARRVPLYNQVWSGLRNDSAPEADRYHERILRLAAERGIRAPTNARVLAKLLEASSGRLGPECFGAAELLGS
jgi:2-dehydropantoate 2-reductase